jgi:hypothetical protein
MNRAETSRIKDNPCPVRTVAGGTLIPLSKSVKRIIYWLSSSSKSFQIENAIQIATAREAQGKEHVGGMRSVDSTMVWNLLRPTMKNLEYSTIHGNTRKNNRNASLWD